MSGIKYVYTAPDKKLAKIAVEKGLFDMAPAEKGEKEYKKIFPKILKDALEVDKAFEEELMQSKETAEIAIKSGHAMVYKGEEPVAYIEYLPFVTEVNGEKMLGIVNTGIAVKKEYQKNGIAKNLAFKIVKLLTYANGKIIYLHPGQGKFPIKFVKKLEKMLPGYKAGVLLAGAIGHSAPGTYVAVLVPEENFEDFSYETIEINGKIYINPAKPPKIFKSMKAMEAYQKSKMKEAWAKFDYSALPALVNGEVLPF